MIKDKTKRATLLSALIPCAVFNLIEFFVNDYYYLNFATFILTSCLTLTVLGKTEKFTKILTLTFSTVNFVYFLIKLLKIFITKNYSIEIAIVFSLIVLNLIIAYFTICKRKRKSLNIIFYIFLFAFALSFEYICVIRVIYFSNAFDLLYPLFGIAKIVFYLLVFNAVK